MTDTIHDPKAIGDVFDRALDRCFERVVLGSDDSISFLVLMNNKGEITDQRIAVETTDDFVEPLTNLLVEAKDSIKIYALACVGWLHVKGRDRCAVIIEAGERGNDESLMLAQRYKFRLFPKRKLTLQGRLDLVGMRESRLKRLFKSEDHVGK
ncbi:hypothetical protein ACFL0N_01120 [Pseudomonadota bacterium]